MYAAIQLAMGSKVDRRVLGFVGGQLTNFSNLDAFKGISSSASKLSSALQFASGGQIPSTVVSLSPSDNRKSIISLSNYLDREIQSIELELDKEKEKPEDPTPSLDDDLQDAIQDASIDSGEMDLFKRMVYAEAGGEGKIGMSLVARAILNRAGLIQSGKVGPGTFNAKSGSITDVLYGKSQFSPIEDGRIKQKLSESQLNQAKDAITFAQNPAQLMSALKSEGFDDAKIKKLIAVTGFRNYDSAGYDASQDVNEVVYKRHTFNTAGNSKLAVPQAVAIQMPRTLTPDDGKVRSGDGSFIQGNSGQSDGTHFHIGTNKPGDGSGVATSGFNVIKHFLGKKSVYVGRSKEHIPASAKDNEIREYIKRGQSAHGQTELDLQIGGVDAGNKVAFPLALTEMKYSSADGYGVSANIVGTNAFVGHGRYKPDGSLAAQQLRVLNTGAPDFYGLGRTAAQQQAASSGSRPSVSPPKKSDPVASNKPTAELGPVGKVGKIYLHWNAAGNDNPYGVETKYHSIFTKDGKKHQKTPYSTFSTPGGHTLYRNSKGVGIAVAAMKDSNWAYKPTHTQLDAMTTEAANLAKKWKWGVSNITVNNVATHAEVGSMKDGIKNSPARFDMGAKKDPDNHGPVHSGGDGTRWDLDQLTQSDPEGSGGDKLRNMIKSKMQGGGYIGKNPKVYGGINESASYEQSGMMIMIQPMIIEKSSPSMSGGGNMDKITFAGSGSVNSVNPAAERG